MSLLRSRGEHAEADQLEAEIAEVTTLTARMCGSAGCAVPLPRCR